MSNDTRTPTTTSRLRRFGLAAGAVAGTVGLSIAGALAAVNLAEAASQPTTEELVAEHQARAERTARILSLEGELGRACGDGTRWACGLDVEAVPAFEAVTIYIREDQADGLLPHLGLSHEPPVSGYDWMADEILDHAPIGTTRAFVATADGELLGTAPRS